MKPFSMFKLLTLASLVIYTGEVFGDVLAEPAAAVNLANTQARSAKCATTFNLALKKAKLKSISLTTDAQGNLDQNDPALSAAAESADPGVSTAYTNYGYCLQDIQPPSNADTATACTKLGDDIDEAAKDLTKQCSNAPRTNSDADGAIDTSSDATAKAQNPWGTCLWDAKSCKQIGTGDNDYATSCSEKSLEELAKENGNDTEKLKTFCENQYPAQCGSADKTDLRSVAKDLDTDLTTELGGLKDQIAEKKKELKSAQDKVTEDDKQLKAEPTKFKAQFKQLQDQYDAITKQSNDSQDATLEKNYKQIGADQDAIRAAALNLDQADAAAGAAETKMELLCKAQAQKDTDAKYPMNGVNYGGPNALITLKSRRADFYQNEITSFANNNGADCDGGAYKAALTAQGLATKYLVQAQATLLTDQTALKTQMQIVASKKSDAVYKNLMDQQSKVSSLQQQQKDEYTSFFDDRTKKQKEGITTQQEINELEKKQRAGDKKRKCINTIRSCAKYIGSSASSSSSRETPDLNKAPDILRKLVGLCTRAAKCTPNNSGNASMTVFRDSQYGNLVTVGPNTKTLVSDTPYDTNNSACTDAVAADIEKDPTSIAGPSGDKARKAKAAQEKADADKAAAKANGTTPTSK